MNTKISDKFQCLHCGSFNVILKSTRMWKCTNGHKKIMKLVKMEVCFDCRRQCVDRTLPKMEREEQQDFRCKICQAQIQPDAVKLV